VAVRRVHDERIHSGTYQRLGPGYGVRPDANGRNVDAVTAVYVMLHALGPGRGKLIDYQQWHERETDSMVSFAGLALY